MNNNRNNTNRFVPPAVVPPTSSSDVPNNKQFVPKVEKQDVALNKNNQITLIIPIIVAIVIIMILIITQMVRFQLLLNDIQKNNNQNDNHFVSFSDEQKKLQTHIDNVEKVLKEEIRKAHEEPMLKKLAKNATKSVVAIKAIVDENHSGSGTGVVIARDTKSVLILTNRHVVFEDETSTKPLKIFVSINDGEIVREATVVATPSIPLVDLALVFVGDEKELLKSQWKIAPLGSIEQGDSVYAIGHPLEFSFTTTEGICSAKRNLGTHWAIQHTAAINPGNSGGPLFDSNGNIVGINTYSRKNAQGIFFALSADFVREQSQWKFYEKEEQTKLLLEKVQYVKK